MRIGAAVRALDERFVDFTARHGLRILRYALGLVFLWFGALKVAGVSPVEDLVADMLRFLPRDLAVRGLGTLEVLVGLGLLSGVAIRVTLGLFFLQMLGTFSILVLRAPDSFDANPLRLTLLGEFVIKNIVLGAGGLAIAGRARRARRDASVPEMLAEPVDDTAPQQGGPEARRAG